MSALDVQVGGDHYKKYKIQPMEYSMANGLDACQHTAIKYITRFRDKGGIADLEKAKHCIDLLIEFERKAGQIETTDLSSKERTFESREKKLEVGTRLRYVRETTSYFTEGEEYEIQNFDEAGTFYLIDKEGDRHGWEPASAKDYFVRA